MKTDALKHIRRIQGIPDKNLNLKTSSGQKEMIKLLNFIIENSLDLKDKDMIVEVNSNKYHITFSYYESSSYDFTSSNGYWAASVKVIGPNKSIVFKEYKNRSEHYKSRKKKLDIRYEIVEPLDSGQVCTMINKYGIIYDRYYHPNFSELIQKYSYLGQGLHINNNYWSEENGISVRKKDDGTIVIEENSSSLGILSEYSKKPGDKYITIIKNGKQYYYDIKKKKLLNKKKSKEENIPEHDYDTDYPEYSPYTEKGSNFDRIILLFSKFDKKVKLTNFTNQELIAIEEQIKNYLVKNEEKAKSYKKI